MSGQSKRPAPPTLASEFFQALDAAVDVVKEFKARHKRAPSDIELRMATVLFIERQKSGGRRALKKPRADHSARNKSSTTRGESGEHGGG